MTESSYQIKAKCVVSGYSTKCLNPDKFLNCSDVLNGQNFRFDFENGYEIWYYGTDDKLTAYHGFTLMFSIYSQDINTETMNYIEFLKTYKRTGVGSTEATAAISSNPFCDCASPSIKKTLIFNVDYFDLCTTCRERK